MIGMIYMWIVSLLTWPMFGHCYIDEVCPYICISDRIYLAGSELVKQVKALRRFVEVKLELGFEGVI